MSSVYENGEVDTLDKDEILEAEDINNEEKEEIEETQDDKETTKGSKKNSLLRELLSWVITFVAAIVIAMVLKNYIVINATVPTGSMENTIMPKDNIIGFRLAYKFTTPKRGDIIIFKYPDDENEQYIKRIIGESGDHVEIKDAKIYINGSEKPLDEPYLKEEWNVETGPYEFDVPEDSYLVLGDNRNNSWDARYWENTYVKKDKIVGKGIVKYFPFNHMGILK